MWDEILLARAAAATRYPRTPRLAAAVLARLRPTPPRPRGSAGMRLAGALVAVAIATAVITTLVSRDVRDAVADFLGLAVEGERIEVLPTRPPGTTPTPFPTPQSLAFISTPVALSEAERIAGFAPVLPAGMGDPEAIYPVLYDTQRVIVLHYPEFDLWEARGGIAVKGILGEFGKGVPVQSVVEQLEVRGRPAYWITGGAHIVRFLDASGREVAGSQRTVVGNTLVWRSGDTNYRLEAGAMSKERALAIAALLP